MASVVGDILVSVCSVVSKTKELILECISLEHSGYYCANYSEYACLFSDGRLAASRVMTSAASFLQHRSMSLQSGGHHL